MCIHKTYSFFRKGIKGWGYGSIVFVPNPYIIIQIIANNKYYIWMGIEFGILTIRSIHSQEPEKKYNL